MSEPAADAAGPGRVIASTVHQQGLHCAMKRSSAQPLLHQPVTSLSGGNSVFSNLREQGYALFPPAALLWQMSAQCAPSEEAPKDSAFLGHTGEMV